MKITNEFLKEVMPQSTEKNRLKYIEWLNYFMPKYSIDSDKEVAAFIAQIGHESGYLRYSEEIASGKAYEGRRDLGNIYAGDGMKYKGRGLIQITGRYNYAQLSKDLGEDFIKNPELLSTPKYAVQSACWFWNKNKLNDLV
jgi:putative chitinase